MNSSKPVIIIVDDNAEHGDLLETVFSYEGAFECIVLESAEDFPEAKWELEGETPALIVMDVHGHVDGISVGVPMAKKIFGDNVRIMLVSCHDFNLAGGIKDLPKNVKFKPKDFCGCTPFVWAQEILDEFGIYI